MKANIVERRDGLRKRIQAFFADERGATSIEYSLIVGLIFLAIVGSVRAFTSSTNGMYDDIDSAMTGGG